MFEKNLQNAFFSKNSEKTSIDKLLARNEIERVKELIVKKDLGRAGTIELLYMCLGTESKLINLSAWDRYVLLKFFVWIREFTKVVELMYDHWEYLDREEKAGNLTLSKRSWQLMDNNKRLMEHNTKFLVDLYLNIGRTTLSLGGTAFMELLKNKFEMVYTPMGDINTPMNSQNNGGFKWFGQGKNKGN